MPIPGQSFGDYVKSSFNFGDGTDGNVADKLNAAILAALARLHQRQQQGQPMEQLGEPPPPPAPTMAPPSTRRPIR